MTASYCLRTVDELIQYASAERSKGANAGTGRLSDPFLRAAFCTAREPSPLSNTSLNHQLLELCDGFGRVQALRTRLGAVQNGVAAIEPERVLKGVEALASGLVSRVVHPAIGLQ